MENPRHDGGRWMREISFYSYRDFVPAVVGFYRKGAEEEKMMIFSFLTHYGFFCSILCLEEVSKAALPQMGASHDNQGFV